MRVPTPRLVVVSSAIATLCASGPALTAPVPGQGTWQATLQARDIDRDGVADAYYDTELNITWLRDWNANGPMVWEDATRWANSLNLHGVTGWRLPRVIDVGADGCNLSYAGGTDCGSNVDPATSEIAHMFYATLGNAALCPPGDEQCEHPRSAGAYGLTNTAEFTSMQEELYLTETIYAPQSTLRWDFHMDIGVQGVAGMYVQGYAAAVHSGDVGVAASTPPAWMAMLAALGGLLLARRSPRRPSLRWHTHAT